MSGEPTSGFRSWFKHLAFRLMRPGLVPVHERVEDVSAQIKGLGDRLDRLEAEGRKYDSELGYWRWLIKEGGSEKDFGAPFAEVFGRWQRNRLIKLGVFLGLAPLGEPGDIDDWCAARSVIEIGAGPYPAVAAAAKGWLRCVAVDPIAKGYVEEDLVPEAAKRVVYIAAPGEQVPLPAGFADLLVIENCLDHVSDPERVVNEMRRLLRPGGYLWLFVDLSNHCDEMHPHPFNEDRVRGILRTSGFEVVRDEVSAHKAHPEAYGGYRGLLRKPEHGAEYGGLRAEASVAAPRPIHETNGHAPQAAVNGAAKPARV